MKPLSDMSEADIAAFIEAHLPSNKTNKDKYGEVFTPPALIEKMLDLFPPRVWTDPHLKWLDPSAGAGFFLLFVYLRLMRGLETWQPSAKKRSNHIIAHMLHMVELRAANCRLCRQLFGPRAQIVCADFLSDSVYPDKTFEFDCIVGNPPFQDDITKTKTKTESNRRVNGGKSKLYERIFLKAFGLLRDGGWLSFLVPDNLFSGNGSKSYQTLMEFGTVPFVSFNPINQSFFKNIQQPICYFLVQKTKTKTKTTTTTVEHDDALSFQVRLQDRPVNPVRNWTPYTERLVRKYVGAERNTVRYNRGKSVRAYTRKKNKAKTKKRKIRVLYTPSKTLETSDAALAPGLGVPKAVLFAISPEELAFKMDYTGQFGVGPNTFYIPFDTVAQGKRLERFLNSEEYRVLAQATRTSRQFLKIAFLEHLRLDAILSFSSGRKTRKKKK